GALPETMVEVRGWRPLGEALVAAGRAARLGPSFWVAAERRSLAAAIWPGRRFEPDVVEPPARRPPTWSERDGALAEVIRAHLGLAGPTTAARLAAALDLSVS